MKPKFIQINCTEGKKVDLRQSKAVLEYRPDLIFLEYSTNSLKPITKPRHISKEVVEKYPWTESDNYMWDNIAESWEAKHKILVYAVDGPQDLVGKANIYPCNEKNPRKTTNLFWWVRIYLRDIFMAKNIETILKRIKTKNEPLVLVFLQSFHWNDAKFLLSRPSKKKIWDFYFGRFEKLTTQDLKKSIQKENKILYKYWNSRINRLR